MNFQEKNILVVGGSSGIGLSLLKLLDENSAQIYTVSSSESNDWPNGIQHLPLDITGNIDALSEFLPDKIHGLVYSVGSINLKPFNRLTEEDFLNDYRLNVLGAARVIQQSLRQLKNAAGE